ncbi:MAG: 4-hydroxy-3-methylbut-2-enyl diphosphate reductase, partial [Pseudomonadota bacterium]|nr:4-hydroxy-3-methylbut-2-enyl diphosphate reductase [Pseudomonadota bacterium]
GCLQTFLISKIDEVNWQLVGESSSIGLTASASAPEILIEEFILALKNRYEVEVIKNEVAIENISFKIPKELK